MPLSPIASVEGVDSHPAVSIRMFDARLMHTILIGLLVFTETAEHLNRGGEGGGAESHIFIHFRHTWKSCHSIIIMYGCVGIHHERYTYTQAHDSTRDDSTHESIINL